MYWTAPELQYPVSAEKWECSADARQQGERPIDDVMPKAYPIFLEKGLKVIFYLLLDKKTLVVLTGI